jgi:hypothetical protein
MRLVLAGRWPCGLVLAKTTTAQNVRTLYGTHLEKGAAAPREPQAICSLNAPSASRSSSSWQRCSNSCPRFSEWQVEKVAIAPSLTPEARRTIEAAGLDDLTEGLNA